VDLGCGSGALLNSLLEEPNSLQQIVGVDLSRKHLIRAAKVRTEFGVHKINFSAVAVRVFIAKGSDSIWFL
jgi:ubiquinone/menaquinone biosynthesis C-methylase UbiE